MYCESFGKISNWIIILTYTISSRIIHSRRKNKALTLVFYGLVKKILREGVLYKKKKVELRYDDLVRPVKAEWCLIQESSLELSSVNFK